MPTQTPLFVVLELAVDIGEDLNDLIQTLLLFMVVEVHDPV